MNLKKITFILMLATTISLGSCNKTSSDSSGSTTTSEITENYISVSEALALIPEETGYEASERVLVKGVIALTIDCITFHHPFYKKIEIGTCLSL